MTRPHQSLLLGMVAVLLLRLSLTDDFLVYVKPVMRPWLVLAGVALIVVAVSLSVATPHDHAPAGYPDDDRYRSDDHGGPPSLAWLLALPIAAVFVVAPEPLGSYAAARQASWTPPTLSAQAEWPLRSPIRGAHELRLNEFNIRAFYDPAGGLEGVPIRLVGFARRDDQAEGSFLLTRFVVSCCAADAVAVSVRVTGLAAPPPPNDTWVEVEGTWVPTPPDPTWSTGGGDDNWAALQAATVQVIDQPREPYESAWSG